MFFVLFRKHFPVETDTTAVAESEKAVSPQSGGGQNDSGVVIETRNLSKIYRDFWGRTKVHALKSLDIEVLHDLPGVGDNLQDHPRAAVTFQSKKALGFDRERASRRADRRREN